MLDKYDRRLLYELDMNSAARITDLAKKLHRSKQFVLYRMNRLEKHGIITGYHAIVDMSKLGYFTFRVYFKFQQMTEKDGQCFVGHVRNQLHQVWTITSMHGKWDFALFLGVRTIAEFHEIWEKIMLGYKQHIKSYNVALYTPIYNFNRAFFLDGDTTFVERVYGLGEKEETDSIDWNIIEEYASNVQQNASEIARKIGIAPDTVRARIRNLEKQGIIVGYKLGLNLEKLGYVGYRVDLQLLSTKRNAELFEYCKQHKNIYQINKSIGGADFEIEAIVEDLSHLIRLLDEIKIRFKDVISDVEYFGFSTFHILKYIPD